MKKLSALSCCALGFALTLTPLMHAADTLDMWYIDVEGGKSLLIKTPAGQSVLIDAGTPSPLNVSRILAAAKAAGVTSIDYMLMTHFDVDHAGNIPSLAAAIPIKTFIDHGKPMNVSKVAGNVKAASDYLAFIPGKDRMIPKPGDQLPLKDVSVTFVSGDEKFITSPPKIAGAGAGKPNAACPAEPRPESQVDDNSGAIGEIWQFGNFRMADFGDLLAWVENRLVCPVNNLGHVDLFNVNHHGVNLSNTPELVAALSPKATIMNNGPRRGSSPETAATLTNAPSKPDQWQIHFAPMLSAEQNAPDDHIANLATGEDQGFMIKVSASKDGSFTITNLRNNVSKTYK